MHEQENVTIHRRGRHRDLVEKKTDKCVTEQWPFQPWILILEVSTPSTSPPFEGEEEARIGFSASLREDLHHCRPSATKYSSSMNEYYHASSHPYLMSKDKRKEDVQ